MVDLRCSNFSTATDLLSSRAADSDEAAKTDGTGRHRVSVEKSISACFLALESAEQTEKDTLRSSGTNFEQSEL